MAVLQEQVQAEVLLRVVQPMVSGGGQVNGQPALLCRPQFSLLQQQQLRFTEERKEFHSVQGISRLKALSIKTWSSVEHSCLAVLGYNIKDITCKYVSTK